MSKNYMADVAKMLDVELGEEFDIEVYRLNPYRLTENGLVDVSGAIYKTDIARLLLGEIEITKKPWKPKTGEVYYYIDANRGKAYNAVWSNHPMMVSNYLIGNVFRTEKEAEANIEAYLKYTSCGPDLSWRVK